MATGQPSFDEVRDSIARFERRTFLEAVAGIGAEIVGASGYVRRSDGSDVLMAHHFLARIALVSAVYGRDHGRQATRDDAIEASAMWNEMEDPFLQVANEEASVDDVHAMLIRTSWVQFPVQERPQDNLRIWFGIYARAREAGILDDNFDALWASTFSLPLVEWYRASLIYWLLVIAPNLPNEALGHPDNVKAIGLEPHHTIGELRARASRFGPAAANLEDVVRDLSQNYDDLRSHYAATRPDDPRFERYVPNPLASRPIIQPDATHFVLPVARLFGNALGLATLYRLMETDGKFSATFGRAFEFYVGETLRESFAQTLPEDTYRVGGAEWGGFDWTVIQDSFALLIECRISRIPFAAKSTGEVSSIIDGLKRAIAEPASKMPEKEDHIRRGLTKTPSDIFERPVHRLIVTVEHMHLEALYTELAGYDPKCPEAPIVVSIAGLQRLLSVAGKPVHELIEEYRVEYVSMKSGSIDQWLRGHKDFKGRIGNHPVPRSDRQRLLPNSLAGTA